MNINEVVKDGRTAIITGGANGIGLASAKAFAAAGMNLCIADNDEAQLEIAKAEMADVQSELLFVKTDVSDFDSVMALREKVESTFDDVAVVMNNAGIGGGGGAMTNLEGWQKVMSVNLFGIIHGVQAFAPMLVEQGKPAIIINTGSKQGLTNPPGNAAYNASKAGVRFLTESLAHELRNTEGCQVSAHLLVPGFTYTGLIKKHVADKPPAAWTSEQVTEFMLERLAAGDFYIICPDNDVTVAMDHRRIEWNTRDIIENRPALSRWHPDYSEEFADFVKT
jgi:NAD(P)-dependent dehydrogenase (short-subunit alcohol dehydrogenase family)